jgi:hypothetical protein
MSRHKTTVESADAEACRINIGPRERRARRTFGWVAIGLGVVVGAWMVATHTGRLVRLVDFIPFYVGAIGIFQAYEKT